MAAAKLVKTALLLGLTMWAATAASAKTQYLFALVDSTAQEALDFNRGVLTYTSSRVSLNLRGDGTTINFTLYPAAAFASGNLPPGALAVVGGSFDDAVTWQADFGDNIMFPLSPSIAQLNTTADFGLGPPLELLVYELARPMMRNLLATTFGVINTGTPACNALVAAVRTEFDSNGLPRATVVSASSDVVADVTALSARGVQNIFSCASSPGAILNTTQAAISVGSTVVFPFSTPLGVNSALAGITVPDNTVWAPSWLPNITNTTNFLVGACAAVTTLTSEHVVEGCLAAAAIERFVRFMDITGNSALFRTLVNEMATLSTRGWIIGPYTPTCRVTTIVDALTYAGGALKLAADADANMIPCSINTALRMPPIIGVQLVYNNTDSIAAADGIVAGVRAYTAARNQLRQSPVYVQRILVPTPSGPLPSGAMATIQKAVNSSFGLGLLGCVDVSRALIDELGIFSLGRVDSTAVAASQALDDTTFVANDGLVFSLFEGEILTAFLFARGAAGRGGNLSLVVAVDDGAGPLWFETAQVTLNEYQQAYHMTGGAAIATSTATLLATTQSYDFTMVVGPPTVAYAQSVCTVINGAATHVLIPQMLGDSVVFTAALSQCLTKPWNALFMRDAVPSSAKALNLQGFAARGYILATLADTLFSLAVQTDVSRFGLPLNVQSALYHSSSLAVDDVTFGGLTSVPCSLAQPGEACECAEASRTRTVYDANGLEALVLQVSPCDYGSLTVPSASTKYLTGNIAMCCSAFGIVLIVALITLRANSIQLAPSDLTANADPRLLKSVTEEVQAVLPNVHKRTSIFMLPFFLVSASIGLSAALTLHFTMVGRLNDLAVERDNLRQVESAAACAASFVNFLLPVPSATQLPALKNTCVSSALQLELPTLAAFTATLLNAASPILQAQNTLAATDLPFGNVLCPLADNLAMTVLQHGADQTSLTVATAASLRVGGVLALLSYFSPITNAVAFATGDSTNAPLLSADDVAAYQCFATGYTTLAAMLNSPVVQSPNTLAFVQSNDGWLVYTVLSCLAGNVASDGKMTLATAACVSSALGSNTPAYVTNLTGNWSITVIDEALTTVREVARGPQRDDLDQYLTSLWLATAVAVVTGTIVRVMAGRVMKVSAAQFTDAVTRSKVIEANIARYISVSMLELMNIGSVHDITGDGVTRDVVVVHIDYYRALYKGVKKLSVTHGELLQQIGQAITADAGSGRVESVSDQGATILYDSAVDAVRNAVRLEAALTAVLMGTSSTSSLNVRDVKRAAASAYDDIDDETDEASESTSSPTGTPPTPAPNLTLESPEEASGQVPAVTIALHRDVVAVGFMFTGRYQFPGAHGNAIRTAKRLATAARCYGARIVATSNVVNSIPADEQSLLVTRELGAIKGRLFDAMVVFEVCIPVPRCRLDEYKPSTVEVMRAISEAQQECGVPATAEQSERYVAAVARAAQMAREADVTDPAIAEKFRWSGGAPYDVLE